MTEGNASGRSCSSANKRNYFELFGLPMSFSIDEAALAQRYRALQAKFHPDRFSHASGAEQRAAAQVSADVNAGYHLLRSPTRRAAYFLELQGIDTAVVERQPLDGPFLFQQMEWRERAEEARTADEKAALLAMAETAFDAELCDFQNALTTQDWTTASTIWLRLSYIDKFIAQCRR
jgi:molecular chaperone HscB